jgi:ribonuclease P protein component
MDWATRHDANVQAAEPQADQQARVSCADEDQGWTGDAEPSQAAGSRAARGNDRQQVVDLSPERGEDLPRSIRIRHSTEIKALLERGKRKRTRNLDVFFTPSPASRSRLGVIVPKHGREIVERNRLKRRLREIGRRSVLPSLDVGGRGGDLLIRARKQAYEVGFSELLLEVTEAVEALCLDES